MLSFPDCKINLGLYVTNRRADGYHDIETVFYPVAMHDALEVVPAKGETTLTISGMEIAGDIYSNLVWKAYQLMKQDFGDRIPAVDIYLNKTLPMGAGLGGGSSDGAYMLRLLNDYCKLGLTKETLAAYALQLGSDCPFFIYDTPQFATGRGEQLQPIELNLSAYSLQLICPKVHVSTAKAFGMMTPKSASFDLRKLSTLNIQEWKNNISNDFEGPVFKEHPQLAGIKQQLYNHGAIYASMSGSGSALYGIFPKGQKAEITTDIAFDSYFIE